MDTKDTTINGHVRRIRLKLVGFRIEVDLLCDSTYLASTWEDTVTYLDDTQKGNIIQLSGHRNMLTQV